MQHNNVPSTCTASLITGWSIGGLGDANEKSRINARLQCVNNLISLGFKRDFAILHLFVTQNQVTNYGLEDFLLKIGMKPVLHGIKTDDKAHRHQETGDLWLYACTPKDYEEHLTAYKKELEARKDVIDPPKKPDLARQKFPRLLREVLITNKIVQQNTKMDNGIHAVLIVDASVAERFIKLTFGFDVKKWFDKNGQDWTRKTIRQIKAANVEWRNELV